MADLFSDHWNATAGGATIEDPRTMIAPGLKDAGMKIARATASVQVATAAADVVRFVTLPSGARIFNIFLSHPADATTSATGNFGLHTSGAGGAVKDLDLFCAVGTVPMSDLTAAMVRLDMTILAAVTDEARGLALWEMLALGAGSDTEDPLELWDITMTIAAEVGIVVSEYVLEVWYTLPGN